MKASRFSYRSLLLLILLAAFTGAQAQNKKEVINSLVEGKRFVFKAQTVLPTGMPSRQVGGENYDLKILGDSLVSYLPYFGRAFVAPIANQGGGYNFRSTDFEYNSKRTKKGGWEITIRPKDVTDFREFFFSVSAKGYANLRAISNNRQMISYNGIISSVE